LTLLPPDLVEAILDGRQTDAAQRQVLLHIPSASWNEQIRVLGDERLKAIPTDLCLP
jgi:hypothetical protein